jgi:hypothetical protein
MLVLPMSYRPGSVGFLKEESMHAKLVVNEALNQPRTVPKYHLAPMHDDVSS